MLCTVLETIAAGKEKFKAEVIIDILSGKETAEIKSYHLEELDAFGSVTGDEVALLNAVIRQAMINGYIAKEIENYGVLRLTEAGKEYLENPKSFTITKDHEYASDLEETPQRSGSACAMDPALFSMLKDLRKKLSKRMELPPFVIFQDPSLEAMATTYPITLEALQNIPGVGVGKAKRYGQEFIDLIRKHVDVNEIERPEDLRVRTVANKSRLKIEIIQAIDLLDEVDSIVYSGTKINIDYFLHEIMDQERIDEAFDYFKNQAQTDNVEEALRNLGEDDYTEPEIRLIRIKFLSELGN